MENKNTLIALMLMMTIWFGYSLFFQPSPPVSQNSDQNSINSGFSDSQTKDNLPQAEPLAVNAIALDSVPDTLEMAAPAKNITVENDLYRAVFSTKGARLVSFEMKKYKATSDPQSPYIFLVEDSIFQNGTLNTSGIGSINFLNDSNYSVDQNVDHVVLEKDQEKKLIFSFVNTNGVRIDKIYTFNGNEYSFNLSLSVSNLSSNDISGNVFLSLNHPFEEALKGDSLTFVGPVTLTSEGLKTDNPDDIEKESQQYGSDVVWSAFENKYFISAVIPLNGASDKVRIEESNKYILNLFSSPTVIISPQNSVSFNYLLYFGPRDLDILKNVDHDLSKAIDFGYFSIIAKPLLHVLKFFYSYIGNYGVAIIFLTIIIKLLFWPLTQKSYVSMKNMQKLQPQMQKIREKYKNNREKQNLEMMELYKTHRVNPMGGCLPMLVQIPVFFALYKVLLGAIELRQAPFAFWITDLSLKDPYYVTPLVMGLTMFIQQKLTPSTMDPTQAKIFMLMPVIFTFLFLNFPSGLVIYWLVNNLLTILQQYFIQKKT